MTTGREPQPRATGAGLPRLDLLRQMSDRTVFEALAAGRVATRAEVASSTGLSKPTVSQAVRRLEQAGLVAATGAQSGRRGGVGTYYGIPLAAGVVVAVELDQAGMTVRTCDLAGQVLSDTTWPPTTPGDAAALGSALYAAVAASGADTVVGPLIRAAAVSVANPVDPVSRRVVALPDAPFPEGFVQPVELLADLVSGPVHVDNDVNFAALAERRHVTAASFVYLYLGGGLGASVHVGDLLVRGAHGLAGEVGWLPTGPDPARRDILARYLVGTPRGAEGPPVLDVAAVLAVLDQPEHPGHVETVSRLGSAATFAASALCAAVDPTLVVLGGPLGKHPALLAAVTSALQRAWPHPVRVEPSTLGHLAPLEGATAIALAAARDAALAAVSAS